MKHHIKACKFSQNCRHKEKCAYKHDKDENTLKFNDEDKVASLERTVKKLLQFKIDSEPKIKSLEKEVQSLKKKKVNEMTCKLNHLPEVESLTENSVKLKSEFELLKLCQRNQNIKLSENKDQGTSSKCLECNECDLIFQTATGLKVHNDLVHQKESVAPEELKCKHCFVTCSDLVVIKKHIAREHRFQCKECDATFKEESDLKSHNKTNEKILINK